MLRIILGVVIALLLYSIITDPITKDFLYDTIDKYKQSTHQLSSSENSSSIVSFGGATIVQ